MDGAGVSAEQYPLLALPRPVLMGESAAGWEKKSE